MKTTDSSISTVLKITIAAVSLGLLLSGCAPLENLRNKLRGQAQKTADEVTKKAQEIKTQVEETEASVRQKVEEVKSAAKEVREAVEAVDKLSN